MLVEALVARQGQSEAQISIVAPPVVVYYFIGEVSCVLAQGRSHGPAAGRACFCDGCGCCLLARGSYAQGRAAIGVAPRLRGAEERLGAGS